MHYAEAKGILSARNGMNPYRGCQHGCIYCDSRSVCYSFTHDFEDIEVKINAPELLDSALRRKRRKCVISTGSMCDPYMPIEATEKITRKCLEVIHARGFGAAVLTKSDFVLRDLDLLVAINEKCRAVVEMTLTTCDDKLSRILEPNVCTTVERYKTLLKLKQAGVPRVVWMTPLLPFINDTEENMNGVLDMCFDAGVSGIVTFGAGVTLREGDREYFYQKLDEHFPGMKQRYAREFGLAYICNSPDVERLQEIFERRCRDAGVMYEPEEIFDWISRIEPDETQLSIFD